jgi:hypothetical protein
MAAINVKDLQTHEVLSSVALSAIHGGGRSADYPISRPLFIYADPSAFAISLTDSVDSILAQKSTIDTL